MQEATLAADINSVSELILSDETERTIDPSLEEITTLDTVNGSESSSFSYSTIKYRRSKEEDGFESRDFVTFQTCIALGEE